MPDSPKGFSRSRLTSRQRYAPTTLSRISSEYFVKIMLLGFTIVISGAFAHELSFPLVAEDSAEIVEALKHNFSLTELHVRVLFPLSRLSIHSRRPVRALIDSVLGGVLVHHSQSENPPAERTVNRFFFASSANRAEPRYPQPVLCPYLLSAISGKFLLSLLTCIASVCAVLTSYGQFLELTNLSSLCLFGNHIDHLGAIAALYSLTRLVIRRNMLTSLEVPTTQLPPVCCKRLTPPFRALAGCPLWSAWISRPIRSPSCRTPSLCCLIFASFSLVETASRLFHRRSTRCILFVYGLLREKKKKRKNVQGR